MNGFIRLVGDQGAVEIFGIRLVGINAENGEKLLATIVFILVVLVVARGLRALVRWTWTGESNLRLEFWTRQAIHLVTAALLLLGVLSIWFDDPMRLATALGLVSAGLAFALQKVVTAVAGYFVILRGRTFNVGDRITMGGVRGDVIGLGFIQTTIMEMGQPPPVQSDAPAMWVQSREYTGRVVTVSNDKIFDQPVYNYRRDFPYIWEEMSVPVAYGADRRRAEKILLMVAERHSVSVTDLSREALEEMRRRYFVKPAEVKPRVYYRLTDNWLELTVRFIVEDHGIRVVKDAMSRDILCELERAGIEVASASFAIVGLPPLRIEKGGAGNERRSIQRSDPSITG